MFCSANDVFLNFTAKTKVLAQKCTQQIRNVHQSSHTFSTINHNNHKNRQHHPNPQQNIQTVHANDTSDVSASFGTVKRIKSISKSQNDVQQLTAASRARSQTTDAEKFSDELILKFTSTSPHKRKTSAASAISSSNSRSLATCLNSLTGSLRLRRRKSLSDRDSASSRRKLSIANNGYATTRWYVKVSI